VLIPHEYNALTFNDEGEIKIMLTSNSKRKNDVRKLNTKIKATLVACAMVCSGSVFAAELPPPSGYSKIKNGAGADLYSDSTGKVYVQVVDLLNGGGVSFDAHAGLVDYSNKIYKRESLDYLYNFFNSSSLFSMTNGQFFDNNSSTTKLSFPVKGSWNQLATINGEVNLSKRTLYIKTDGYAYIEDGYNASLLSDYDVSDLIVSLHPDVGKSSGFKIGRSYIGGYSANCSVSADCKYTHLIFLVAANKKQSQMETIASNWGILPKSLIMMDGSGSAQIKAGNKSLYGSNSTIRHNEEKRELPHVISIYEGL
jgi:hypothetical protein